jgi:hypothetical protein
MVDDGLIVHISNNVVCTVNFITQVFEVMSVITKTAQCRLYRGTDENA